MNNDTGDTTLVMRLDLPVPPSVLIVDDDPLVLDRLRALVTDSGYLVHAVTSGAEALEWLEQSRASIVITDVAMPGMDGLELCRRIRARTWPAYVYVILLTIRDEEKNILTGLDAGADDYLSKRMSAAHFTARLRTAKRVLTLEYSLQSALESKRQLAMTDALTGIYNRRYFLRHISRELKRVQRSRGDLSLILFDIDNFKQINDIHGHAVGDDVLKAITRACAGCLRRETDWCARLGGDEFAVVLEGTCLTEAGASAKSLLRAIAKVSVRAGARSVKVTASIGVSGIQAVGARESATVQALMETADNCLYVSKRRGRNCVTVADEKPSHPSVGLVGEHRGIHDDTKIEVDSFRR